MLSASFGVLSQNTGFYPSLDRIIETTLGPLNLGPRGGSYNEPISRLQRLPQSRREEVTKIMKEQMSSGKYEPSSASYRSTFFAVEKKGGALRVVHDLQPLNAVTVRDATLPPRVDNTIESFPGTPVYALFDLNSRYYTR